MKKPKSRNSYALSKLQGKTSSTGPSTRAKVAGTANLKKAQDPRLVVGNVDLQQLGAN